MLVHGFGGSGTLFYKVMKGLAQNFYLIIIDLIGMGSSSRPYWEGKTAMYADAYFMVAIETWRVNLDNLTNFYIAAHSYGAYLFGSYAAMNPQHVRKLILLSPLGVKDKPENFSLNKIRWRRGRGPPYWAVAFGKLLWGKVSPFAFFQVGSEARVRKTLSRYVTRA